MKPRYSLFAFALLCIAGSACKNAAEIRACRDKPLGDMLFEFETNLEDWLALGGSGEAFQATDIQISDDTAFTGLQSVKFTVSPESYVNGGNRAELTFDQGIEAGDETHYAYSLFIPHDYQDVASIEAADGAPNWQVVGQWHDQPDVCIGETWDDLAGNSPPIALYYLFLNKEDPAYGQLLTDPTIGDIFGVDTTWDQQSVLSLVYGNRTIAITPIEKGQWYRLNFDIKWSKEDDGFIEATINNQALTDGRVMGPNMLNLASHYFKFGLYRNPTIPYTNSLYYDEIAIY